MFAILMFVIALTLSALGLDPTRCGAFTRFDVYTALVTPEVLMGGIGICFLLAASDCSHIAENIGQVIRRPGII